MTTVKGFLRSYNASIKRYEREQQRKTREAAKRFKELQKQQAIEDAAQAVLDWNNYVQTLISLHTETTEPIDWLKLKKTPQPQEPIKSNHREKQAEFALNKYKPSLLDKLFNSSKRKIFNLENNLRLAKRYDDKHYDLDLKKFQDDLLDWKELQEIINGVDKRLPEYYLKALQYFNPFDDIQELGSQIKFDISENFVDIDLKINDKEVIPDYEVSQTSTGKLSKKSMPKTRFNELYQDHVCSSILRVGREIFSYLPIDLVRINAICELLNSKTGHLEDQPIVSILISKSTLNKLNLKNIDPSDSMENFIHNMNFKKNTGFNPVYRIELEN